MIIPAHSTCRILTDYQDLAQLNATQIKSLCRCLLLPARIQHLKYTPWSWTTELKLKSLEWQLDLSRSPSPLRSELEKWAGCVCLCSCIQPTLQVLSARLQNGTGWAVWVMNWCLYPRRMSIAMWYPLCSPVTRGVSYPLDTQGTSGLSVINLTFTLQRAFPLAPEDPYVCSSSETVSVAFWLWCVGSTSFICVQTHLRAE